MTRGARAPRFTMQATRATRPADRQPRAWLTVPGSRISPGTVAAHVTEGAEPVLETGRQRRLPFVVRQRIRCDEAEQEYPQLLRAGGGRRDEVPGLGRIGLEVVQLPDRLPLLRDQNQL